MDCVVSLLEGFLYVLQNCTLFVRLVLLPYPPAKSFIIVLKAQSTVCQDRHINSDIKSILFINCHALIALRVDMM